MNIVDLCIMLERHEGKRTKPYKCSAGKLTVGIGHNLEDSDLPEFIIQGLLAHDIERSIKICEILFPNWRAIPEDKQLVLVNMAFQLGGRGLGKFVKMILAVNMRIWGEAADQMLDSKWFKHDTPGRAKELADIMRS